MNLPHEISERIVNNLHEGIRFVDRRDFSVTYWNRGAESITGYTEKEIVGRICSGEIPFHFDDKGSPLCDICPFVDALKKETNCERLMYIRHKGGALTPVHSCIEPVKDETGSVIGVLEIFSDISWKFSALQRIDELNRLSLLDPLTFAGNRRYGEMTINAKLEELKRYGIRFGLLFIDIDDFKGINDLYGHAFGDTMIRLLARSLMKCLRSFDMLSRWGGDEFVGMAVNLHDHDQLTALCRRLCHCAERSTLQVMDHTVSATVSIGATIARYGDSLEDLLARTDTSMYQSKRSGKNHYCVQ